MKKVYFDEEKRISPLKKMGYWFINVGVFVLLGILSAAAVCLTIALL